MAPQISRNQVAILAGLGIPLALTAALVPFRSSVPNTDAALALILVVVGVAASGHRLAGVLAAASAAVWFDFFLTMPYERFTITGRTDIETTVLLLAIGVAVTEIAVWGRRQHAAAARRGGYLDGLNAAARAVATGESAAALTGQVGEQLTRLLSLSGCRYQNGAAGIGHPARLLRDGRILLGDRGWDIERAGLTAGTEIELLVEAGGLLQGRFLLTPGPLTHPSLEERLVAVALADQAGSALASGQLAGIRR
jgi:K+-sensing histidine kinase KdpD